MADDARMQPQPSMKVAMQQNVDLPTDLGLLAGECPSSTFHPWAGIDSRTLADTFIMPTGANKPSILSTPRLRLKVEWQRIKARMVDFGR